MKKIGLILFIALISIACNRQANRQASNDNMIDLSRQLSNRIVGKVSDFADAVSHIILETCNESLLPAHSFIIHIDSQNIFVLGRHRVYRFDGNGNFKNRIGSRGQGPGEFESLYAAIVDYDNHQVLMLAPGGRVLIHDFDGNFKHQIRLSDNADHQAHYAGNGTFAVIAHCAENGFTTLLRVYSNEGELLQTHILMTDTYDFFRGVRSVPLLYNALGYLNIKFLYNDTIFRLSDGNIIASKMLYTGRFRPSREMVEYFDRRDNLERNFLQIIHIVETERYMFFQAWRNGMQGFIYDKESGRFLHSGSIATRFVRTIGVENDITGYGKFWPRIVVQGANKIAQLIDPHYLGFTDMEEDANPVVQIVHLR